MSAGGEILDDGTGRRTEPLRGIEHLIGGGDVVFLASQQIDRAFHIAQIQPVPKADKLTLEEAVVLEQLADRLQVPASGQIDGLLVPALELLEAGDVSLLIDVFVEIDVLVESIVSRDACS